MSNARAQTRDLLLEYDHKIMLSRPCAAGLDMAYLWGNYPLDKNVINLPIDPSFNEIPTIYPYTTLFSLINYIK